MDMEATKTTRNRSKKFESSEITLITELVQQNISIISDKYKSSHGTSSVTSEKKCSESTLPKGSTLKVCVLDPPKKLRLNGPICTKRSKMHTQRRPVTTRKLAVIHHQNPSQRRKRRTSTFTKIAPVLLGCSHQLIPVLLQQVQYVFFCLLCMYFMSSIDITIQVAGLKNNDTRNGNSI
ncbi:unnamed protein product [Mytilus edulis]|uniref:Uncharacterized protein n=1 Tax=Mytilus edulis TaxID=6550 RepID=A0A8S3R896_MYTED|nr:unnamed protein product [Mytilus edulis]